MFSLLWKIVSVLFGVAFGFFTGVIAADIVGVGAGLGIVFSLADDVLVFIYRGALSGGEIFALQIFLDEAEKVMHETITWAQEDDDQRAARHAALVRWHGDKIYLFGDVHLEDALLLWFSGGMIAESSLPTSVFGLVAEETTVLL